jgi:GMP synthase-like glutamine amidotransferase
MNTVIKKPVVIFRFLAHEGPGYLGDFLDAQNIPWQLIKVDEGALIPSSILAYSGMVLMGGPMSVNDDLPWIAPLLDLIRQAKHNDIPLLGHCLGGQLMSKALGANVTKNTIKEIGWGEVTVSKSDAAKHWFGEIETFNAFHWHGETFSIPAGANHLLASPHCQNQAWSIDKHVAFQTHVEMTPDMVKKWCEEGEVELRESAGSVAVQQSNAMQENLAVHCFFLNKVATQVYGQWIQGLKV